jgi:hypothetical protein
MILPHMLVYVVINGIAFHQASRGTSRPSTSGFTTDEARPHLN